MSEIKNGFSAYMDQKWHHQNAMRYNLPPMRKFFGGLANPKNELILRRLDNSSSLEWRHNGRDSVSNHQPHDCLLNRLSRCRSKKTSKPRVTGLCVGNSPGTGEFPTQRASNAENVLIWWRHHVLCFNAAYIANWDMCRPMCVVSAFNAFLSYSTPHEMCTQFGLCCGLVQPI